MKDACEEIKDSDICDHKVTCQVSGEPIKGVRYFARYKKNDREEEINLSEEAFL